jgi:hypothetical protein
MVTDTTTAGGRLGAETCGDGEAPAQERPGIASLFRDLIGCTQTLLRQEIQLARAEMAEKARTAARNSASIGIGGAVALLGGFALVLAACGGLYSIFLSAGMSPGIAMWLAPLIIGAIVAGIGYAMIQKGLSTMRELTVVPERTTESLKETGRWMQDKVS